MDGSVGSDFGEEKMGGVYNMNYSIGSQRKGDMVGFMEDDI